MSECKCGREGTEEFHPCPYEQDINSNDEDVCNCCAQCQSDCADDI